MTLPNENDLLAEALLRLRSAVLRKVAERRGFRMEESEFLSWVRTESDRMILARMASPAAEPEQSTVLQLLRKLSFWR